MRINLSEVARELDASLSVFDNSDKETIAELLPNSGVSNGGYSAYQALGKAFNLTELELDEVGTLVNKLVLIKAIKASMEEF